MISVKAGIPISQENITSVKDTYNETFISLYDRLLKHEGKQYNQKEIRSLPFVDDHSPLYKEWQFKLLSSMKLFQYLNQKNRQLKILDLGCGNGWFSNMLTGINNSQVWAADIYYKELQQGIRSFAENEQLLFTFFDIRNDEFPHKDLDVIILVDMIHYLPSAIKTIDKLLPLLNEKGEIHILDSPIVPLKKKTDAEAKQRLYLNSAGIPEMFQYIYIHTLEELMIYSSHLLYDPNTLLNRVSRKIIKETESPFPWIMIKKDEQ